MINQTHEEVFDSITGFDEIAITTHFGHTLGELTVTDSSMFVRALIFVVKRREGLDDVKAREAALALTLKECNEEFFAEQSEEEAGKDEQPEQPPASSLTSVSEPGEPKLSISS